MKLSDTQLLILCSASQRTDHAAVPPANLKGGAAKKVVDKLLHEKLLQELRAKDDMPVWQRGDDNRPYSLRITKAGLRAIEVEDAAEASDKNGAADPDEVAIALDALVKETQWQKQSVRGFLAGTVHKKLKLPLLSEKIDGVRNYRIGTGKAAKTKKTSAARKA